MAGVGNKILAADYNQIQSRIELTLGPGASRDGYGQGDRQSTPRAVGQRINLNDWLRLRNDMIRVRQHQTGQTIGNSNALDGLNLLRPTTSDLITEELRNQYDNMRRLIRDDRYVCAPNQGTLTTIHQASQTLVWRNVKIHEIKVTSSNDGAGRAANFRYFFNAGGQLRFYAVLNRAGEASTSVAKNASWEKIFSNDDPFYTSYYGGATRPNVIRFDYANTTAPTGNNSTVGFYDLTNTYQFIFGKEAEAGVYAENDLVIKAKCNVADNSQGGATQLTFRIEYRDDSVGVFNPPRVRNDELVSPFTSYVQMFRPSGSNVNVRGLGATLGSASNLA
jgi:hypothetical protein